MIDSWLRGTAVRSEVGGRSRLKMSAPPTETTNPVTATSAIAPKIATTSVRRNAGRRRGRGGRGGWPVVARRVFVGLAGPVRPAAGRVGGWGDGGRWG